MNPNGAQIMRCFLIFPMGFMRTGKHRLLLQFLVLQDCRSPKHAGRSGKVAPALYDCKVLAYNSLSIDLAALQS